MFKNMNKNLKEIEVNTLKQLEGDVNKRYDDYLDYFINNNKNIAEQIFKKNIVDFKVIEERFADQQGLLQTTFYCSKCQQKKVYTKNDYQYNHIFNSYKHIDKCDCKDIPVYKISKNISYDYIKKNIDSFDFYHDFIQNHSFFYPIVNQDNILAIGQFNFKSYLYKQNGEFILKAVPDNTMLYSTKDKDVYINNVFIVSKKYGLRFINPSTRQIQPNYNIPKIIKEQFNYQEGSSYSKESLLIKREFRDSTLNKYQPIIDFQLINKEILDYTKKEFTTAEELSGPNFINTFFTFKKQKQSRRRGVDRFLLTQFNEKELYDDILVSISDQLKPIVGSLTYPQNKYSRTFSTIKDEFVNINRYKEDVKVKCHKCNSFTKGEVFIDDYTNEDISGVDIEESIYFSKDVYCPQCKELLLNKGCDYDNSNKIYINSNQLSLILYDVDSKGRLVERIFDYNSNIWNNDIDFFEKVRTIFYEESSPNIRVQYVKDSANEPYKRCDERYGVICNQVKFIQNKKEIRDILNHTDYKYSAFEDVVFKNSISTTKKLLYYQNSYMYKYLNNSSLELIARISSYDNLLQEILEGNTPLYSNSNTKIATNLPDALLMSKEAFAIFHKLPKKYKIEKYRWLILDGVSMFGNEFNNHIFEKFIEHNMQHFDLEIMKQIKDNHDISLKQSIRYIEDVMRYQRIMDTNYILILWRDYLNMAKRLGRRLDNRNIKYPNSLKREHDIVSYDIKTIMNDDHELTDEEKENFDNLKKLEYQDDNFSIIAPKSKQEIIQEGNKLNHCVASYANDVASGKTIIMFMRKVDNIEEPLYTIEMNNNYNIVQVRGSHNKSVNKVNEFEFLQKYNKALKSK